MKTTAYLVKTLGYYDCPIYLNLKEAKDFLKEITMDSLVRAKRLSKTARKHKIGTNHYMITLGSDTRSTCYAEHYIREIK